MVKKKNQLARLDLTGRDIKTKTRLIFVKNVSRE